MRKQRIGRGVVAKSTFWISNGGEEDADADEEAKSSQEGSTLTLTHGGIIVWPWFADGAGERATWPAGRIGGRKGGKGRREKSATV